MTNPSATPRKRLRNRLMLAFAGFTLVVATLFGLYVAVFAYAVEDMFFNGLLEREANEQLQHHAQTGAWKAPRESWMQVIESATQLPDSIASTLAREPRRREFPGSDGRHYHLQRLQPDAAAEPAWLLAEVSQLLVVRPQRAGLFQLLAWSGVAVITLALLLGAWLAGRTTAPLSRLAQLVDNTGPDHLPAVHAQRFADDEVGVLARGLEALIIRIRAFVIREREFTRDASHELRTPLAVIRGTTERLARDPSLSPAARQGLSQIHQSALQLEQTISMLLALAREQALPATGEANRLLPVIERVVVEQAPLLDDKQIELDIDVPFAANSTLPLAVLQVLLANLIGNAFAHTAAGTIRVAAEAEQLRISNPGDGISDQALDAFSKGANSGGFGLGLAIVQRLCEQHGIALDIRHHDGLTSVAFPLMPAPATS
ncbi:sensor histidine kinase [Stenotrophomonas terrae]|nr:HAMP domain-containing sensor histidine kinase [Stenotrophomonas terrae]